MSGSYRCHIHNPPFYQLNPVILVQYQITHNNILCQIICPQHHLSTFITLATFSYSSAFIFLSKLSPSEVRLTHPLPRLFISSQARRRSPGLSSARTDKTCEACITSF